MKFYLNLVLAFVVAQSAWAASYNITCYYDTFSIERGGYANFTELDLTTSLEYCTHIVFGYVGLHPAKYEITTLHPRQRQQFSKIKKLKNQYRHIKFLLSLGGGKDWKSTENYMKLLNRNGEGHESLIRSARKFLLKYKFDGLDLAYQFPKTKFKKHSTTKKVLKQATNLLKKTHLVQKKSKKLSPQIQNIVEKQQFYLLVNKFKSAFRPDKLMLTLTVLPHVNASKYLDIPAIIKELDFINLGTYDYSTPERSPKEADFLAPLQTPPSTSKHLRPSIESDVRQWLSHHIPAKKLNLGIPTFARTWKLTKELKSNVMPITSSLKGAALGGELTHTPGKLSWTEVCKRLDKMSKTKDKMYGNYAYRAANVKGHEGILITYEDEASLAEKAEFVRKQSLGGVAIFDLTLDDFRGKCKGGKFPALKAIKFRLH